MDNVEILHNKSYPLRSARTLYVIIKKRRQHTCDKGRNSAVSETFKVNSQFGLLISFASKIASFKQIDLLIVLCSLHMEVLDNSKAL